MRVFDGEDGFTPYSATVDGITLTESQGDTVERVSRLVRRPAWDGHVNATDNAMTDGFASGDVDGVAVAWIDGQAYELAPVTHGVNMTGAGTPPFCSCGFIGGRGIAIDGRPLLAEHLRTVGAL